MTRAKHFRYIQMNVHMNIAAAAGYRLQGEVDDAGSRSARPRAGASRIVAGTSSRSHIQVMAVAVTKFLALGLGLVLAVTGAARADDPPPLRFELTENGAFRGNHTNVRHAWDGDCERLLASVRPDELPPEPLDPDRSVVCVRSRGPRTQDGSSH